MTVRRAAWHLGVRVAASLAVCVYVLAAVADACARERHAQLTTDLED